MEDWTAGARGNTPAMGGLNRMAGQAGQSSQMAVGAITAGARARGNRKALKSLNRVRGCLLAPNVLNFKLRGAFFLAFSKTSDSQRDLDDRNPA